MAEEKDIWALCRKYGLEPHIGVLCGWDWLVKHQDDPYPEPKEDFQHPLNRKPHSWNTPPSTNRRLL